jgi:hypothetical protein
MPRSSHLVDDAPITAFRKKLALLVWSFAIIAVARHSGPRGVRGGVRCV